MGVGPDQGLGVALCKKFAEEGYKVFGCGRSEENMKALEKISTTNGDIVLEEKFHPRPAYHLIVEDNIVTDSHEVIFTND